jgi:5'-deoxynucleotidase YfbR-like HD superfamily hydrolase
MKSLIQFFRSVGSLKKTVRTGWSRVGITSPESVAEHTLRSTFIAMCIGDLKGLNTEKLMKMMLLHDLQESLTGDYDTHAKQAFEEKELRAIEVEAIQRILALLPKGLKSNYFSLWKEFQDKKTVEAKIARQVDKLEMLLQALEYEKEGYNRKRLQAFWKYSRGQFNDPDLKALFLSVEAERS